MCKTEDGIVRYAPLCIHTFRLIAPRKIMEAQSFNKQYRSYSEIENIQDRLRWCRHNMGLMQKEVAERIGTSRWYYKALESGAVDYYSKDIVDKLTILFDIPIEDLLDSYNLFLYKGQGRLIREYRESVGLNNNQFARMLNIDPVMLRNWENDKKRMTVNSWEKHFKSKIKI